MRVDGMTLPENAARAQVLPAGQLGFTDSGS
jgi:hypothetical protein